MTPEELAALRSSATRPRRTVPIVLAGNLQQEIEELDVEIDKAEAAPASDRRLTSRSQEAIIAPLLARRAELVAEAESMTLQVTIEGLPGTDYRALLAAHPPRTVDGKPDPRDALGANEETVRAPLVRSCIVDLDDDTAQWLLGFVTDRQMDELVVAALAVNRRPDAVPLPRRPSPTRTSEDE